MAEVQCDSIIFAVNTHAYIIAREKKVKQQPDQLQTQSQRARRAAGDTIDILRPSTSLDNYEFKGVAISKANESEI